MTRLPLLRSTIVASLLCLVSAAASVGAPILLDQSHTPDGVNDFRTVFSCIVGEGPPTSLVQCGQSFTVGLSGILTAGELHFKSAFGTLIVGLYDISDISGTPTLLETSSTTVAVASPGFYSFAFSTPVTVGNTLALLVDLDDFGDKVDLSGEPGYAAGAFTAFIDGVIASDPSNPNVDLYFRTYVDVNPVGVPEPASSLLLLGVGLAGLAAGRVLGVIKG